MSEDYLVKRFDGFVGIKEIKGHGAKVNPLTKRKLTETRTETQQQRDETYSLTRKIIITISSSESASTGNLLCLNAKQGGMITYIVE